MWIEYNIDNIPLNALSIILLLPSSQAWCHEKQTRKSEEQMKKENRDRRGYRDTPGIFPSDFWRCFVINTLSRWWQGKCSRRKMLGRMGVSQPFELCVFLLSSRGSHVILSEGYSWFEPFLPSRGRRLFRYYRELPVGVLTATKQPPKMHNETGFVGEWYLSRETMTIMDLFKEVSVTIINSRRMTPCQTPQTWWLNGNSLPDGITYIYI